jgi:cation diffusion facilitator CzcD-associated flavoprotein CzcO
MSNDYYPSLRRENVAVETDRIARVTETGVVTVDVAGRETEHEVDTIIFGTGFKVADGLARMNVTGRDGVKLADAWSEGPEALLGTTVAGFPNLFTIVGPNTGLGHSSMVFMVESQLNYVLDAMRTVDRHRAVAIDTRSESQAEFNDEIQRRLGRAVWARGGCASWYLDEHGRNRTLWPGYTFDFRRRTRKLDPGNHELVA